MGDPDLELRRGPGYNWLAQSAFLPSVISSFFTENKGEGIGPPGPSPRSATEMYTIPLKKVQSAVCIPSLVCSLCILPLVSWSAVSSLTDRPHAYQCSVTLFLSISRRHEASPFLSRVFVSHSQPIRFARFDGKSLNRGLPVLDQTRALDPRHRPEGSWALGTSMTGPAKRIKIHQSHSLPLIFFFPFKSF